jgi:hypothetical protein
MTIRLSGCCRTSRTLPGLGARGVTNVEIMHGTNLGAARTPDRVSANPCRHLHMRRRGGRRENGRTDPGGATPRRSGRKLTAVFFGRTTPQITNPGGLWDESQTFYPRLGGTPHLGMREWRWPRRGKIKFSHLQFDTTVYDWQGLRSR